MTKEELWDKYKAPIDSGLMIMGQTDFYAAISEHTSQETTELREKAEKLEDGLREIEQMSDPGSPELAIVRMKAIATNLLKIIQ